MTGNYSNPVPEGYEPVEVVVRHPDFEDDFFLFGLTHRTVYIDLGASFDVTKIGPEDREQIEEWAEGVKEQVRDLPADHPARKHVEEVVDETLAECD